MTWKGEGQRHSMSAKGIKTYSKEPSVMKPRRNIHQLTPIFNNKNDFEKYMLSNYMFVYEQIFYSSYYQIKGINEGDTVPIEIFYWKKRFDDKFELLFKEHKYVSEISNIEQFKKYADGEIRKVK